MMMRGWWRNESATEGVNKEQEEQQHQQNPRRMNAARSNTTTRAQEKEDILMGRIIGSRAGGDKKDKRQERTGDVHKERKTS